MHQELAMATIIKSLIATIFLSLIVKGCCECSFNNITVGTERSGREIEGKTEWKVTVINNCSCPQNHIRVECRGFQSTESVDPFIFYNQDPSCILIHGNHLQPFASVTFFYAWDPPFLLPPIFSVSHCS